MTLFSEKEIIRWEDGVTEKVSDDIVIESSLDIVVNGGTLATLLSSPANQKELAVGYLSSEGLIDDPDVLRKIDILPEEGRVEMQADNNLLNLEDYSNREEALTSSFSRSSSLMELMEDQEGLKFEKPCRDSFPEPTKIITLMKELQKRADLFHKTGGSHTAALARNGDIEYLSEDIGRHNAIDKAVGKAILARSNLEEFTLLTSGRLSSEMVLKALRNSIPIVVSRSAPTNIAVKLGRLTGLKIVGFVRGERLSVYSGTKTLKD